MSALDPNQGPPFYHCWAGLYGWQPAGRTTLGNASRPRPGHSACSSCSGQDGSRLSPPGASSSHCSPEELARGRLGLPTVKARRATSRGANLALLRSQRLWASSAPTRAGLALRAPAPALRIHSQGGGKNSGLGPRRAEAYPEALFLSISC